MSGAHGRRFVVPRTNVRNAMRKLNLAAMQIEDLWQLYEQLAKTLADRIAAERHGLETRLAKAASSEVGGRMRARVPLSRRDPKVVPEHCSPLTPPQQWSGREGRDG
jgi:hypothetical protein